MDQVEADKELILPGGQGPHPVQLPDFVEKILAHGVGSFHFIMLAGARLQSYWQPQS
jgi:hypothetical protein